MVLAATACFSSMQVFFFDRERRGESALRCGRRRRVSSSILYFAQHQTCAASVRPWRDSKQQCRDRAVLGLGIYSFRVSKRRATANLFPLPVVSKPARRHGEVKSDLNLAAQKEECGEDRRMQMRRDEMRRTSSSEIDGDGDRRGWVETREWLGDDGL